MEPRRTETLEVTVVITERVDTVSLELHRERSVIAIDAVTDDPVAKVILGIRSTIERRGRYWLKEKRHER